MIIDADTHVDPALTVLEEYASVELRNQWDEVEPYSRRIAQHDGSERQMLSVNPIEFSRQPRETFKEEHLTPRGPGGRAAFGVGGRAATTAQGVGAIDWSVSDKGSSLRLANMDAEGVDIHLLIPGPWSVGCTEMPRHLADGLYAAFHRYMADFCSVDQGRLKGILLLGAWDPLGSAEIVKARRDDRWLAGASIMLPSGMAIDDEALAPIWQALVDSDLPYVFHPFTYEPPYFPGYKDVWGNVILARSAAFPWSAQRIVGAMVIGGLFDRWPSLRIGFSETGAGWLPSWLKRIDMNRQYLSGPTTGIGAVEAAMSGRIFCAIEMYEGAETALAVTAQLGDGVLMYGSDFPHPECEWPNSVAHVQSWSAQLGQETMTRLMGENAAQFLRLL